MLGETKAVRESQPSTFNTNEWYVLWWFSFLPLFVFILILCSAIHLWFQHIVCLHVDCSSCCLYLFINPYWQFMLIVASCVY